MKKVKKKSSQKIITDTSNRLNINYSWTSKEINGLGGRQE
jgi:hypothetical protein